MKKEQYLENLIRPLVQEVLKEGFSERDAMNLKKHLEESLDLLDRYNGNKMQARILYNAIDKFLGENPL